MGFEHFFVLCRFKFHNRGQLKFIATQCFSTGFSLQYFYCCYQTHITEVLFLITAWCVRIVFLLWFRFEGFGASPSLSVCTFSSLVAHVCVFQLVLISSPVSVSAVLTLSLYVTLCPSQSRSSPLVFFIFSSSYWFIKS